MCKSIAVTKHNVCSVKLISLHVRAENRALIGTMEANRQCWASIESERFYRIVCQFYSSCLNGELKRMKEAFVMHNIESKGNFGNYEHLFIETCKNGQIRTAKELARLIPSVLKAVPLATRFAGTEQVRKWLQSHELHRKGTD